MLDQRAARTIVDDLRRRRREGATVAELLTLFRSNKPDKRQFRRWLSHNEPPKFLTDKSLRILEPLRGLTSPPDAGTGDQCCASKSFRQALSDTDFLLSTDPRTKKLADVYEGYAGDKDGRFAKARLEIRPCIHCGGCEAIFTRLRAGRFMRQKVFSGSLALVNGFAFLLFLDAAACLQLRIPDDLEKHPMIGILLAPEHDDGIEIGARKVVLARVTNGCWDGWTNKERSAFAQAMMANDAASSASGLMTAARFWPA